MQLFASADRLPDREAPINVASIPQRSLFRYPGGKTWFVPAFRKWLKSLGRKPSLLVEPFAGGGIISLTGLFENLVDQALLVEIDPEIASVWETVIAGNSEWLADRILNFSLSRETVLAELSRPPEDSRQRAFQTILKNRVLHGGILAKGSGFIKQGESGKGLASRWYPATLAARLRNLDLIVSKMKFYQDDGIKILQEYTDKPDAVYFIDPPYTAGGKKAGRRLYNHSDLDHEKLFRLAQTLKGDFLMTYDNAPEVRQMAINHGFKITTIPMNNTHHAEIRELVIARDLTWLENF